jgi:hypothetical protein
MQVGNPPGAGFHAQAAPGAFRGVYFNSTGLTVNRERPGWTGFDTGIVFTLEAEMRYLNPWDKHENPYPRCLRPDFSLMLERTGDFTSSAAAAMLVPPTDPNPVYTVQ